MHTTHPSALTARARLAAAAAAALSLALAVAPSAAAQARPDRPDSTRADSTRPQRLEGMTVTAIRAGGEAPISEKTIDRQAIERRYFGQDVPLALQGLAPSLTVHGETGTYWGYSYVRLRGVDQSRINLSLDGIPLNDPEDQVLYFANFPDLANSIGSVQVQRGVGTSGAGTASFAGSINFETLPLATMRRGAELQLTGGSFGSRRASLEGSTGLTQRGFAAYGRLSSLETDGYRYHSDVLGRSAFLSAGWFGRRDALKLIATAGLMRDTMAYYAVAESELAHDRRVNPLVPKAGDQFGQRIVALAHTRQLSERASLATTLYRIAASGRYDVWFDEASLYDFHLDFAWYGLTSTWSWTGAGTRLNAGVNANTYARDHYARARADRAELYANTGHKRDASAFAKLAWDAGPVTLFGDLQGRWAEFRYTPDDAAGIVGPTVDWAFLNPKVGATWRARPGVALYASYGRTSREPTRSDMFGGNDNLDAATLDFLGSLDRVRPERVHDLEAGVEITRRTLALQANLFAMHFRNEIAPIGRVNELGTQLRKNVGRSTRRGVEADASWRPDARLELGGSLTLMRARIAEYTDDATGEAFRDVAPLLTPQVLASQRAFVRPTRSLQLGLTGRYQGRAFLANTGDERFVLPASYVVDGSVAWTHGRLGVAAHANNVLDSDRYGSGYTDGSESYYYVLPPRNLLLTLTLGL